MLRRSDYDSLNDRSSRCDGQPSVGGTNPSNSLRRNTSTFSVQRALDTLRKKEIIWQKGRGIYLMDDTELVGWYRDRMSARTKHSIDAGTPAIALAAPKTKDN